MINLSELVDRLGPHVVVTDPDLVQGHTTDWTRRWQGHSPAVILPRSTTEVIAVVDWCREHGTAIVAQGGNTGMVGGSVPLDGEVVVSLRHMNQVSVDADAGLVTADAGATLASVQDAASAAGWLYGVDLGARDTATVGGTIATNAGGLRVMRYGDTRHQLLGVEAVTGAGELVGDLRGLVKDNTGYHLPSLLAGSEGTLAVVTRACLRLLPRPDETVVALIGFDTPETAVAAVARTRRGLGDLQALELFFDDGLALVCRELDLPSPLPQQHAAYLLLEAAGSAGVMDRLAADIDAAELPTDAVAVGVDDAQRQRLWRYREGHTEAISLIGVPHKLDVTLPLPAMAGFVTDVRDVVTGYAPEAHTWIFGHAGDGNLHVNVTGVDPADHEIDTLVLELVAERGGSISAEHGIGRAKAAHLHLNRSAAEIAVARRIKTAFDPASILNPGVLFPGSA